MNVEQLLKQPGIWRGRGRSLRHSSDLPTGWPALDRQLGGWPRGALSEIIGDTGNGRLTLVMPALRLLTRAWRRVLCVAPPHLPYPPAWTQLGIELSGLLRIDAEPVDALWSAEQALRSGTCGAVLCWPQAIEDRQLRRLQLAAEQGNCHGFIFRPPNAEHSPSPATLRLVVDSPGSVKVLKCRNFSGRGFRFSVNNLPLCAQRGIEEDSSRSAKSNPPPPC